MTLFYSSLNTRTTDIRDIEKKQRNIILFIIQYHGVYKLLFLYLAKNFKNMLLYVCEISKIENYKLLKLRICTMCLLIQRIVHL